MQIQLLFGKITIKGNYSYTAEQMIDYVHKKVLKRGVLKESIDTESLEKSIRKNFGDISWVCVEVKGTNLIIHIKRKLHYGNKCKGR